MAKLKLKAFVMVESMFSMIIIMTCFMIAMMTFIAITNSGTGKLGVRARIALQSEAANTKAEDRLIDEDIIQKEFTIRRRVISNDEHPELIHLSLTAINNEGKTIAELHEFVLH